MKLRKENLTFIYLIQSLVNQIFRLIKNENFLEYDIFNNSNFEQTNYSEFCLNK